ncbi:hypothetical protein CFP65_5661 [Kitasatospora sp. MMS16-BH015]|uniref:hypothetical protein n=1 Tax=Kitasatospora sp. MMS16-BH015 TaxID=2018025 RepID=UPI000CA17F10|nr:hypothetical protein [Kitasatospora sp. MMS16-BH015]AUG80355.1 hypothetical protein CFP65_5661 [Kitasatospora sp. MMS16-BH015]
MLRSVVRGVTTVAAVVVAEAGKRAEGLLERMAAEPFPPTVKSLRTLAGEAVTAGRAGVDLAVGVVKSETERAFELVGDQVVKVGVVLGYLESKLREVEEPAAPEPAAAPPKSRAEGLFETGWEAEPVPAEAREPETEPEPEFEEVPLDEAPVVAAAAPVKKAAVKKTSAKKTAPAKKAAVKKATAKKATPAKKATTKKAAPRKAVGEGE